MAEIACAQAFQAAVLMDQIQERVGGIEQTVVAVAAERPAQWLRLGEVERHRSMLEDPPTQRGGMRVGQCQAKVAQVNLAQQAFGTDVVMCLPGQTRTLRGAQFGQVLVMTGAGDDVEVAGGNVVEGSRTRAAAAVDDLLGDEFIRCGKAHPELASGCDGESGRGHVHHAAFGGLQQGLDRAWEQRPHLDSQVPGEFSYECVFEAVRPVGTLVVSGRTLPGGDHQHAVFLYVLQDRQRLVPQQEKHPGQAGEQQAAGNHDSDPALRRCRRLHQ